ncbi:hypothetical protein [uncultured Draconibacterium sp.]|uniref:hypothetical protein n=1 Tax=uncultured Draconibacterium sp. TaxID=1573823 RepID=UPI0025D918E9|nr:hypothetical protein [uncultured Draconibacterium sp.]
MATLSESKKRDFVSQMITLLEQNAQQFSDKGYNPENKIEELRTQLSDADDAEAKQTEAKAAAKDATKQAQKTLDVAYRNGSATVDLISGLLGKDDNLLLEIKKLRK